MCFASAKAQGAGRAEWSTFPVHKVNVSGSREIKDIKHMEITSFYRTTFFKKKRSESHHKSSLKLVQIAFFICSVTTIK